VAVGVVVGVGVEVGVGVGVAVGVNVGVGVGTTVAVAVGVAIGVAVGVSVAVTITVEVAVGATLVGSGFFRNPNTSTVTRAVRIMAAKKAAGTKIGIVIRLLLSSLLREAPHTRHSLALRATRVPQAGQYLFSSAILARFQNRLPKLDSRLAETQLVGDVLHGRKDDTDVLVQLHTQIGSPFLNGFSMHTRGESLVFPLFVH
jgi:hypothetical protein